MFKFTLLLSLAIPFIDQVEAHGNVLSVLLGGNNYTGYLPFTDPYGQPPPARVIRHVPNDGPVTILNSSTIACNVGGEQPAQLTANVPAGSAVKFQWSNWPTDHIGPVATWMGSCDGNCQTVDLSKVQFFKIDQAGYNAQTKQWGSQQLMAQGSSWQSTIPVSLAPGQYLLRHEIIALHSVGAAQVYPSCAQVNVAGSGNQTPTSSELVDITTVYSNSEFPDIWTSNAPFTMPGPAVFGGDSASSAPSASDSSSASPTSTTTGSGPSSPPVSSSSPSSSLPSSSVAPTLASTSFVSAPIASATGKCRSKNVKRHHRHDTFAKHGH